MAAGGRLSKRDSHTANHTRRVTTELNVLLGFKKAEPQWGQSLRRKPQKQNQKPEAVVLSVRLGNMDPVSNPEYLY